MIDERAAAVARRMALMARMQNVAKEGWGNDPILSASTASNMIGASPQRTLDGLKRLGSAGVLTQISRGTWGRQYAARDLFDLVAECETRIAGRKAS